MSLLPAIYTQIRCEKEVLQCQRKAQTLDDFMDNFIVFQPLWHGTVSQYSNGFGIIYIFFKLSKKTKIYWPNCQNLGKYKMFVVKCFGILMGSLWIDTLFNKQSCDQEVFETKTKDLVTIYHNTLSSTSSYNIRSYKR